MQMLTLCVLLAALAACGGVRIGVDKQQFQVSPLEPKLEFFNVFTPEQAPPVMEDPEPENRLLPQAPPGARTFGLQIENVVQALRYRYPDPTTTPRPGSAAARNPLPPGFPHAYARPRPPPLPQPPAAPRFVSHDGNYIDGDQLNPLLAFDTPDVFQGRFMQAQEIRRQTEALQRQRQSQLAQQQIQLAQQKADARELMRQRLRAQLAQQQQEDAYRQQYQPQAQTFLPQYQGQAQTLVPQYQDQFLSFQPQQPLPQAETLQVPAYGQQHIQQLQQVPASPLPAPPQQPGFAVSRTYHVSQGNLQVSQETDHNQ